MAVEIKMQPPWHIPAGITILAASLVPIWTIDLHAAPNEAQIRFWTTAIVGVALWGIARRKTLFRWLLLLLLGTGVVVSVWSFLVAATIEVQSALITLTQMVGLGLLFMPKSNAWFARPNTAARKTIG